MAVRGGEIWKDREIDEAASLDDADDIVCDDNLSGQTSG